MKLSLFKRKLLTTFISCQSPYDKRIDGLYRINKNISIQLWRLVCSSYFNLRRSLSLKHMFSLASNKDNRSKYGTPI